MLKCWFFCIKNKAQLKHSARLKYLHPQNSWDNQEIFNPLVRLKVYLEVIGYTTVKLMLWGLSSKPVSHSLLHRAETRASVWVAHTAGYLEAQPIRYTTPAWYDTWYEAPASAVKTTVGWEAWIDYPNTGQLGALGLAPAHSSASFPQSPGLERVSLAATVPSQAAACQTEDKPSQKFTKLYSLVTWTARNPDGCSWNLFTKQKLSSFKRQCCVHAESCANTPLELNYSFTPNEIWKSAIFVQYLRWFFSVYLALLSFLRHMILQNTDKSPMSPSHQGWQHFGSLLGGRRQCSQAFVTCQMRQCWDAQNTFLLTH